MDLKKYLPPARIIPRINARTKRGAIEELVGHLADEGVVRDRKLALRDILQRERQMSTGMARGLAMPHSATSAVQREVVAMGLAPEGVDFDSIDGEPARAIFLVLFPQGRRGHHLKCLADISRVYSNPSVRQRLAAARSPREIHGALRCNT